MRTTEQIQYIYLYSMVQYNYFTTAVDNRITGAVQAGAGSVWGIFRWPINSQSFFFLADLLLLAADTMSDAKIPSLCLTELNVLPLSYHVVDCSVMCRGGIGSKHGQYTKQELSGILLVRTKGGQHIITALYYLYF